MTNHSGSIFENVPAQAARAGTILKWAAAVALFVIASRSLASAQAPDCVAGSLSAYEKLGSQGCVVGDVTFSDFHYHQAADGVPEDAIAITPGTVPGSDDPALLFEAAWVAPSYQGSSVSYTVAVQPKGKPISGATLEMEFGQISGTGEAKVAAELCPFGDTPQACAVSELKLKVGVAANRAKKAVDSGRLREPLRQVRVTDPLSVVAGKDGSASLNGFMTVFHSSAEGSAAPGGHTATTTIAAGQ